jgi:hypothetical protein
MEYKVANTFLFVNATDKAVKFAITLAYPVQESKASLT